MAIQVNVSCPNQEHDVDPDAIVEALMDTGLPLVVKVNSLFPVKRALGFPNICVSNSLPWADVFKGESPLAKYGGGGVSGRPLLRRTALWVKDARSLGYKGHINAGGGILCKKDVDTLAKVGADSIFIGSVAILRGWRVSGIIKHARKVL